jgi:serine/threonine protein kinase/tetratricopeptide (TPR) repeat protein
VNWFKRKQPASGKSRDARSPAPARDSPDSSDTYLRFENRSPPEPPSADSFSVPPTLGRYEVRRRLGAGGFGAVYLGHDALLDRPVAIKLLRAGSGHPAGAELCRQEARRLASLHHPGIVAVHDIGVHQGQMYIVSDYIEGPDLHSWMRNHRASWSESARIAAAVSDALSHAHARRVIHRDVKPANIILAAGQTPVLVDFGLALSEADAAGGDRNLVCGTPHYMSPEQAGGVAHRIDGRTDIYSLGVVLYELLTGHVPFRTTDLVELLRQVRDDEPQPPRQIVRDIPPRLESACLKALAKHQQDRYTTAADLAEDLQRVFQTSASPDSPADATPTPRSTPLQLDLATPTPSSVRRAGEALSRPIDAVAPVPSPSTSRDRRDQTVGEVPALSQAATTVVDNGPSIAVLPFASLSADADNEFFSDGISEEIINALGQIDGLRVAARTSSFSFKGKTIEVSEIARRLDVRHLLEGSVRKAGTRVRVTAQLVDAANGFQLWSERYDRQIEDIFDVQDEIARAIVDRLKVAFDAGRSPRLVKVTTNNMEAYQEYLKGRAMLYRRGPWIGRALEAFQKAVTLDPGYAQAWAGVADAHTTLAYYGYRRPTDTMPMAVEAATRATAIDPDSAEAHNALAVAALLWERDFSKAERAFREALTLNPRYTQARCWYGLFFLQWSVGRDQEGLAEASLAFENDPLSAYATTVLSLALATVQRFDEAVVRGHNAVEHDPESFLAKWELAFAYHWKGEHDKAILMFEPLWADSGHHWVALGLIPAYVRSGLEDRARSLYASLVERDAREYVQPFVLAVSATAVGDHEAAIRFCEAAIEGRDMLFALFGRWWPDFERVRADRRYADLLARFNSRGSAGS